MLEQKRYKIAIKNARDCQTTIKFLDLNVTYSNGYSHPLELREGDEIPFDVLNAEDVRKSFMVGTLKSYLQNGWIEEILEQVKKEDIIEVKNEPQVLKQEASLRIPQSNLEEAVQNVNKPIENFQVETITDLNKVLSYEDFCKLSQLLKLRFIKDCNNIDLLKQIASSTSSVQIKNNISLKLSQIKI